MRILDESEDSPASMSMGSDMCLTPVPLPTGGQTCV